MKKETQLKTTQFGTRHSPEPWIANMKTRKIISGAGLPVAQLSPIFPRRTTEADARLICAAPAMLEALENIENDAGQMPASAWALIQNAIKAAKGTPTPTFEHGKVAAV